VGGQDREKSLFAHGAQLSTISGVHDGIYHQKSMRI
jgi:hypothetical protein